MIGTWTLSGKARAVLGRWRYLSKDLSQYLQRGWQLSPNILRLDEKRDGHQTLGVFAVLAACPPGPEYVPTRAGTVTILVAFNETNVKAVFVESLRCLATQGESLQLAPLRTSADGLSQ